MSASIPYLAQVLQAFVFLFPTLPPTMFVWLQHGLSSTTTILCFERQLRIFDNGNDTFKVSHKGSQPKGNSWDEPANSHVFVCSAFNTLTKASYIS
jgi:hypothetical protein